MTNTPATITAVITARALVTELENAARSLERSNQLTAARAAFTKRAVEAVAAGNAAHLVDIIQSGEESARFHKALNKIGMFNTYLAARDAVLSERSAARRAAACRTA